MTALPPQFPPPPDLWLAQALQAAGLLTEERRIELQQGDNDTVWARAVQRGYTTDDAIVQALANRFKLRVADLSKVDARTSALLPEALARKHRVLPVAADDRNITLATADPRDVGLEDTLRFVTGRRVSLELAPPDAIEQRIDEAYRPERAINRLLQGLSTSKVETMEEVMALGQILYRAIGVEIQGDAQGSVTVQHCYFSRFYSGQVCDLISALDDGVFSGLSGGGRLVFSERITEGRDFCRAKLILGCK